ncbi:hypothetical protein HPP92_007449 [Vanilla planifolia]|uniref:Uncharacterized protein n=1 Tax=Vanilla planifolia TaxID=51239 RepID=A0A835VBV4_VANPL|nr:hypothetical protein HPP92_007449 [Vanilla planifolia]
MVARLLSTSIDRNAHAWKENKPANIPRVILVVTRSTFTSFRLPKGAYGVE